MNTEEYSDDIEIIPSGVSIEGVEVDEKVAESEEEAFAYKIIKRTASLKGVAIDRTTFLQAELSKKYSADVVEKAIETSPQEAGVSMEVMDELADAAISLETRKVAGLSALAGLPGGLAMIGTIPADLTQYFAHSLRIEQKLAYIYGWESFLNEDDVVDDETMYRLILFLGVMMQVGGANVSLAKFASSTAAAGVAKAIQKQALTKTVWYNPLKKILSVVGVKVTKSSLAEVLSKGVPVIGGVVSGGLTYATFKPGAISLKKYLRTLPQATGEILSEEEMEALVSKIEEESKADYVAALKGALGNAGEKARETAGLAAEKASELGGATVKAASGVAKSGVIGFKKGIGGISSKIASLREKPDDEAGGRDDVEQQLRKLKSLLDDGIITQEDFDQKKKQLLGL